MAYIGNTVENQGFTPAIDYFNGNGVTVTFTLSRPVASVAQVIVAIDNVIQNPNSSFTVAGNAITFSSAPLSGTNNIWVEYTSLITTYQAISQDPTVIGDIRATGGYLAEGDFGNSFVDGAILDYVTGNGRLTVGDADGLTIYNGGTAARTALMTVGATGNVGIGTSSPTNGKLVISGSAVTTGQGIRLVGDTADARFICESATLGAGILGTFSDHSQLFYTNSAERMRINSSGNVGIGTSSPAYKLQVSPGTYLDQLAVFNEAGTWTANGGVVLADYYNNTTLIGGIKISAASSTSGYLSFHTGGTTERMRIDTSGNVGIGTASPAALLDVVGTAYINQITGGRQNGGGNFHLDATSGSCYINFFTGSGLVVGNGTSSGLGAVTASAFNVSDRREKENITYFTNGLDKILQLKPATFNMIGKDKVEAGFIAQDVQEVIPEMLGSFRRPDSDIDILSLSNVGLFPYLVNAIQEQQAIIEDLKARIETLEAK